jgi:hypothetical protein
MALLQQRQSQSTMLVSAPVGLCFPCALCWWVNKALQQCPAVDNLGCEQQEAYVVLRATGYEAQRTYLHAKQTYPAANGSNSRSTNGTSAAGHMQSTKLHSSSGMADGRLSSEL